MKQFVLALLVAGVAAHAGISMNGISMNGRSMNGISMNGRFLNGVPLNGRSMNGVSLNGRQLNGFSCFNGLAVSKNTTQLNPLIKLASQPLTK